MHEYPRDKDVVPGPLSPSAQPGNEARWILASYLDSETWGRSQWALWTFSTGVENEH